MGSIRLGVLWTVVAILALSHPAAAASSDTTETTAPQAVVIDGYRSAHFGMNEREVRRAIRNDLDTDKITVTPNDLERTTVLVLKDQQLLADAPPATVSYILGATSAKLIQVNVVWGEDGGAEVKPIVTTANALVAFFLEKGAYAKGSVAVNQRLPDGSTLAFRGADVDGHMVVLQLVPVIDKTEAEAAAKGHRFEVKKAILKLSYIENPAKPDIFRIKKGQF